MENRKWALHHPLAAMRRKGPITVQQAQRRGDHCAPWFPGGIASAALVTRAEIARAICAEPAHITGFGQWNTHEWVGERMGT